MITKRELEILEHLAGGLTVKEISSLLFISETTVISHRNKLKEKLKAKNTTHLICIATGKGILNFKKIL